MQYIKALWKLNYIANMKLLTLISSKLVIKLTLEPKILLELSANKNKTPGNTLKHQNQFTKV